jgi:hypothetical protein
LCYKVFDSEQRQRFSDDGILSGLSQRLYFVLASVNAYNSDNVVDASSSAKLNVKLVPGHPLPPLTFAAFFMEYTHSRARLVKKG